MADIIAISAPAEPKITASQIEADCPARLRNIAQEIAVRFEKAQKQYEDAEGHVRAISALIDEVKALCDKGGIKKFREVFCPQLGKSQAYVRLAIATGRKTGPQHRAEQRDRKRKSRSKQKSLKSVTVTENTASENPDQTPVSAPPRRSVTRRDPGLLDFTVRISELNRTAGKHSPERFCETAVRVEVLFRLGRLLTDVANLKMSRAVKPEGGTHSASEPPLSSKQPPLSVQLSSRGQ